MHNDQPCESEVPLHERQADRRTGKLTDRITLQHLGLGAIITILGFVAAFGGDRAKVEQDHQDIQQLKQYRELDHTLLIRIAERVGAKTE